ncbi:hypothetical protein ABIE45_000614 [Methylobacterium sp. OAE515]|jgi:hypothetical protein|uniref:hypothetical protein n=1 Tax=Methylobacterium sp. OAE515 TaxID=2817895 RepID=UPI00178B9C67
MRLPLTFVLGLASVSAAYSQTSLLTRPIERPSVNINDCTFVRDPTTLRDCLDLVEGQRLGPTIMRSPPDPIVSPQLLEQAKPDPRSPRSDGSAAARRPALRPVGFDPVRVEQAQPRRRRAVDQ